MPYRKRRISKQEYTAAMAVIPTKEEAQPHTFQEWKRIHANDVHPDYWKEETVSQPTIIPSNQLPLNPTPLGAIQKQAQEESGFIPFLTPEARMFWAKTREQFYVIDAKYNDEAKYGPTWELTFQPLEGPLCKMSFTDIGTGTRDAVIAAIAEQLPVGPCILTHKELSNGYEFFNLEPA